MITILILVTIVASMTFATWLMAGTQTYPDMASRIDPKHTVRPATPVCDLPIPSVTCAAKIAMFQNG